MSDVPVWVVEVNGGQKTYTLKALTAVLAASGAVLRWNGEAKQKWRKAGVYDLKVRRAKFSEIRQQPTFPVRVTDGVPEVMLP